MGSWIEFDMSAEDIEIVGSLSVSETEGAVVNLVIGGAPGIPVRKVKVVVEDDSGRAAALYAAQEREPTCLPELDTLWAYRGIVVNLQVAAEIVLGRNKLVALI